MSQLASTRSLLAAGMAALPCSGAAPAQNANPPDFSGDNAGWVSIGTDYVAVPGGPKPVTFDPAHRYVPNGSGEQLHVVERFHLTNDGKNLQAEIVVDDPAAFKQPLKLIQTWRPVAQGPMSESSCAESGPGFFDFDVEPIPTAAKPDF